MKYLFLVLCLIFAACFIGVADTILILHEEWSRLTMECQLNGGTLVDWVCIDNDSVVELKGN